MIESLASRIRAANVALISEGKLDEVPHFFTAPYVAHLTDQTLERAMKRSVGS